MRKWIKKEDRVLVIAGNDKGKVGKVLAVKNDKMVVQGVNLRKKHLKKTQQAQAGQIIDMEMPIHTSNVVLCNDEGKPIKVKVKKDKNIHRLIYFDDKGNEIVLRTLKSKNK